MLVGNSSPGNREQQSKQDHKQPSDRPRDQDPLHDYLAQDRNGSSPSSSRLIQEVASSAIIDSLAAEWWSLNLSQTVINDLLENLLPLVVLACEKVVKEADERHLVETTSPDRSFNPINLLASFLMRNNPKYMHYSSLSPYHYTMKSLLNTKRVQVLKVYGEEETLLRTVLKQRQSERNEHESATTQEEERRKNLLKTLFHEWNVPARGWVQTKLVNNMLDQFNEMQKPSELKANLGHFPSHRMHLGSFTENFLHGLARESGSNFDATVNLYRRCAQSYSTMVQEYELDRLLQRLFQQLDDKQSGYLFQKNVLQTLQKFYNALNEHDKHYVHQPEQWPVVKQVALPAPKSSPSSPIPTQSPREKPADSLVTNEQPIVPSISTGEAEIKENEPNDDDEEQKLTVDLKNPSAYEASYRFTKEQKPVYNLEHFDAHDHEASIPYDEQLLNKIQFSSLLISFVGVNKNEMVISALIDFFRSHYQETAEEKNEKKTQLHQRQIDAQRRAQCDLLFEKINATCTGVIKMEPLVIFLKQYKDGTVNEQLEQVLQQYQDYPKITSKQFYDLMVNLHQAFNEALGGNEKFDELLKFVENQQPQLNANDRTRSHTRHQWIKRLRNIPFRNADQLYKEVINILQKDSDTFGSQTSKTLSIYIALVENDKNQLRYVATSNDQTDLLLGKTLQRGQGISFSVLDSGKWAYINQTKNHSRLHFFNPAMKHQSGSFVLMPFKRAQSPYSNGLLGIDTIREKKEKAFAQNEVQFYEGVASALSETFALMNFDHQAMELIQRFIHWIQQRCPNVTSVDYYTYEAASTNNPKERLLKHLVRYSNGKSTVFETPIAINSREQVFKYHLEHAAITCQSTMTSFLGQTHMIHALRGPDQYCFALIDTNIGDREDLPDDQKQALTSMYRYLSIAVDELKQEPNDDATKSSLNFEKKSSDMRHKYLFDRLWFTDVCHKIKGIPAEKIQEFIQFKSKWNDQIKQILSTISQLVKKKELNSSEYEKILLPAMVDFDPTATEAASSDQWTRAAQSLKGVDVSTIHPGSVDLVKLLSDWLSLAHELYTISK